MLRHVAFLALACGCDPKNTQDACNDIAHAYCQRAFDLANQDCTNASDWLTAKKFVSLNDCATGFTFLNGSTCANTSTTACAPLDYSSGRAAQCVSDVGNLPCDHDWYSGATDVTTSCAFMCCVHQGDPGSGNECCSGTSHAVANACGTGSTEICD